MKKAVISLIVILCFQSVALFAQASDTLPDSRGYMVRLGEIAPDFTIEFTDGSPSIKLSELKGNVVMLQFTASWCSVCIKEMPHIEKQIWKEYKDKGLKVYGIDRKESKEAVVKFAKKIKVSYPLVMDENGEIFEKYAHPNAGVTRNVLIDKTGKIVFLTRLFDEEEFNRMKAKITELL
jgi:peroxiredoxin